MNPIVYNLTSSWSDVYEIYGDVRIQGISSTIFIASIQEDNSSSWTAKPYARKGDKLAMERIKEFKFKYQPTDKIPHCNQNCTVPAIVFSTGGYVGNHYHAFTDVLSRLFATSQWFNQTVLFLITDYSSDWTSKYKRILDELSKYDVYDIDRESKVLCFSRMIVGLEAHKDFIVDPWDSVHHSIRNFSKFLRSSVYSLGRQSVNHCRTCKTGQPRMLIICRRKSRRLVNKHAVGDLARKVGFEVVLKQMVWNVSLVAEMVNSFDVVVGVHGAGLTNMVFLPENAVVVQIVPFGLDYIARTCFKMAAENMKLRYLDYKVTLNESSLFGNYSSLDTNPNSKKGFEGFRSVYLDNQDINIDLGRFKTTLSRALELVSS
ncbi:Alpha-1,3-arabinosyltransferase XAT3 [Sesamum alatum]|uniref:Alpha-1,3-arabinosyltransferase XAT3 n=1 Tax=Sesamum alatum TaxID=300844 RepID=A0AAE1YW97_9LAMI|nr:Alpha-1,3-arabinosyltransferase XAT3 [Sesamum alatum]